MKPLSVIIITKNEEANILECLESVSWADEIILVDDESTDKTVEIASQYQQVRIFTKKMIKGFGPQKQYALKHVHNEWTFSIDADERITEEGHRDACEFRFCNGTSPIPYLRIRIKVLENLLEEYEQKEI